MPKKLEIGIHINFDKCFILFNFFHKSPSTKKKSLLQHLKIFDKKIFNRITPKFFSLPKFTLKRNVSYPHITTKKKMKKMDFYFPFFYQVTFILGYKANTKWETAVVIQSNQKELSKNIKVQWMNGLEVVQNRSSSMLMQPLHHCAKLVALSKKPTKAFYYFFRRLLLPLFSVWLLHLK